MVMFTLSVVNVSPEAHSTPKKATMCRFVAYWQASAPEAGKACEKRIFKGDAGGFVYALDADTGKVLWSFKTPSGILAQPVTWERNGKQYVTVLSGLGALYAERLGDPNLANTLPGVSLWTFGLFDK